MNKEAHYSKKAEKFGTIRGIAIDEKNKPETGQEMERFDSFVRSTLLEEGNRLREEKGAPPLMEDDLSGIDALSGLKEAFEEKTE